MAAKSTLKNMVLCLGLVCFVCSAILGGVYVLTEAPIAAAAENKTVASIEKVLPEFSGTPVQGNTEWGGASYHYYMVEGTGCAVVAVVSGFGGPLSIMVGILEDGTVHNTTVLSHAETPGLGAKCTSDEKFLSQFRGLDPAATRLVVTKDGGDIDSITASTITSRAYALAVSNALGVYESLRNQMTGGQENE